MNHRCLLIEDDFSVARALRMLLDEAHIDWIHVTNYEDAVRLLMNPDEHFCIIVCDLGILPDTDAAKPDPELGVHLIKRARELFPGKNPAHDRAHYLPIIILSSAGTHTFRRAMQAGATDNLSKPLGVDALDFPETMRLWLSRASREDHATCGESHRLARLATTRSFPPPSAAVASPAPSSDAKRIVLGIPGILHGDSSDITIDGQPARLEHALLGGLLRLVEGKLANRDLVRHEELGMEVKESWKGNSKIEKELTPLLQGRKLIKNLRGRGYRLEDDVVVGPLNVTPYLTEVGLLGSSARDILTLRARGGAARREPEAKVQRRKGEGAAKHR
jgi:DNA-binding response OmpR family regulator